MRAIGQAREGNANNPRTDTASPPTVLGMTSGLDSRTMVCKRFSDLAVRADYANEQIEVGTEKGKVKTKNDHRYTVRAPLSLWESQITEFTISAPTKTESPHVISGDQSRKVTVASSCQPLQVNSSHDGPVSSRRQH